MVSKPASRTQKTRKNVRWQGERGTPSRVDSLHESNLDRNQDVTESDEESSEEDSQESQICLTIMCLRGQLSCSYFDPIKGILHTMEDTDENRHYDLTIRILEQISPTMVLTSSKSDELFMDAVRDHMEKQGGQFQVRPWKEFTPLRGLNRLRSLPLFTCAVSSDGEEMSDNASTNPAQPRSAYEFMRRRGKNIAADPSLTRWSASVRLGNFLLDETRTPFCFSTIGALLEHLARARAVTSDFDSVEELDDVNGIDYIKLEDTVQINADALVSLQIFLDEKHASIYSDAVKEGLSIYGILNQTRTALGRNLLRQWLLRPSMSLKVIKERHDTVACFVNSENIPTSDRIHRNIGGLKGAPLALTRLRKGKATLQNWRAMVQYWANSAMLREGLMELQHSGEISAINDLIEIIGSSTFIQVAEEINDTIDWDESLGAGHISIKTMVDEELDGWKETLAGMDSLLSQVALTIAASIPPESEAGYQELSVVYFPQLGYLISIPIKPEESDVQPAGLDDWKFQFMTDDAAYFKSQKMHDMDYHIGDLHSYIIDREIEILQLLQQTVLEHTGSITAICEQAAVLDCLLSFAAATRQYQWNRPDMVEDNIIDIQEGRHPLQELVDDCFVANDTYAGSPLVNGDNKDTERDEGHSEASTDIPESGIRSTGGKVVICTGANASGKTVYLKQCALIPYMAQIGCFVPATSARLGIIEKVFTRIQTRESTSKMQSAFMIDLNQISLALRNAARSRSLLIIDEFGKGTLPPDGAGLFTGVIKYLLNLGDDCPFVFAATHFHEVLNPLMLAPTLPISFVHMAVMITTDSGNIVDPTNQEGVETPEATFDPGKSLVRPGENVTYLFKVSNGLCLHSHAAKCALTWGIPPRVVNRAQYVSELLNRNELNVLLDERMSEQEKAELVQCENICRRFLEWDLIGLVTNGAYEEVRPLLRKVVGSN